MFNRTKYYW